MGERVAERQGAAEGFTDQGHAAPRGHGVDARIELGDQLADRHCRVAQAMGRDLIPALEQRHLPVVEQPVPSSPGTSTNGSAISWIW